MKLLMRVVARVGALLASLVVCACGAPKVVSTLPSGTLSTTAPDDVVLLASDISIPESIVPLGQIKVGDSGFTATKRGTYEEVEKILRTQASEAGGNAVQIVSLSPPDWYSSVYRATAVVYNIEDFDTLYIQNQESVSDHPDYAVIYLYRNSGAGLAVNYDVYLNDTKVYRSSVNSKAEVKVYEAGQYELWGKTESKQYLSLDIKLGKDYYVMSSVTMGAFVGHPYFELVHPAAGKIEYNSIKDQ